MTEDQTCQWIGILLLIFVFYVGVLVGYNL